MERELNRNLSDNEVYYTNSSILLVKNMLCSKLHCQKGFYLILFAYEIIPGALIRVKGELLEEAAGFGVLLGKI